MPPAKKRSTAVLAAVGLAVVLAVGGLVATTGSLTRTGSVATADATLQPEQDGQQGTWGSAPSVNPTGPTTIVSDLADASVGIYGTRTKVTFRVVASGAKLRYAWQHQAAGGGKWKTIKGAKKSTYTARARSWADGTRFRVVVAGTHGTVTSAVAKLTVLRPTRTPAADAATAFGLTGLTQGVDLSGYQHTPRHTVNLRAVDAWAGAGGFTILRNGSGARPVRQKYTSVCTDKTHRTGSRPVVEDCAYARFADAAQARGLRLGHYWFNGWITTIDTTPKKLFSGDFTPEASAAQFVDWLKKDGNYTRSSTDPLVLDVEAGRAWTKTANGKSYTRKLRAWNPGEAAAFLTEVKALLTADGYQANLYVYMSANAAARQVDGVYRWLSVAPIARLWVASWGTNNGRIPEALPKVGPWEEFGGWSIWQYTSNANIPGDAVGALDGDIATAEAWTPR